MKNSDFTYKKYSGEYKKLFEQMKSKILAEVKNKQIVIEHIGSTAIPGLGGKGIIDVSIGIKEWSDADEILEALKKLGFEHFHEKDSNGIFVSTQTECTEGDFHIHIGRIGTKRYKSTLAFRDYLLANPQEASKYDDLKKKIFEKCRSDRKAYKQLKSKYFEGLKYDERDV